jgi:hypothetical protein
MPQSISIAVLVLGGVLLLVAITGGKFKIFEAEVDSAVSSKLVRLISGAIGIVLITVAVTLGSPISKSDANKTDAQPSQAPALQTPAPQTPAPQTPAPQAAPAPQTHEDQPATVQADPSPAPSVTSPMGSAIVFDPPSNVREAANASSNILCLVTQKTTIHILRSEGNWYVTDVCGKPGYIYRNQVKF